MKFDLTIEHVLQKQIIEKLTYAPKLRFSELKPENIESNLFMYHLKQLIKLGFVEKLENGYTLTPVGLAHVDKLSLKDLKHRVQAKVLTILAIEHEDGKWLMMRRLHQPYIGKIGFPSGKVHYGESLIEAAKRDLEEKADLKDIPLQLRGSFNFIFKSQDIILSNIIAYVFYGKTNTKKGLKKSQGCETYWDKLPKTETDKYIPGYLAIHKELSKNNGLFFIEKSFENVLGDNYRSLDVAI